MKRWMPFLIIVAVLGGVVGTFWHLKRSGDSKRTDNSGRPPASARRESSVGRGAEPPHMLGTEEAPVMIEEFGDFECGPCASLHPVLKTMKAEFGPKLVIVFREFPIVATHKNAMTAARAAEAAARQGKFWEMHDKIYSNQNQWKNSPNAAGDFEKYAVEVGLAMDRFKADVESEFVNQRIALDRERGRSIGVNGTPTVFLNGREVPPESLSADNLRALIQSQVQDR